MEVQLCPILDEQFPPDALTVGDVIRCCLRQMTTLCTQTTRTGIAPITIAGSDPTCSLHTVLRRSCPKSAPSLSYLLALGLQHVPFLGCTPPVASDPPDQPRRNFF